MPQNIPQLLQGRVLGDHDHIVPGPNGIVAAGNDDLAVPPDDARDQDTAPQLQLPQRHVHQIGVRMVYEAANAVNVPIIGMGGIETAEDAIEMLLVGASAVSVGTANFYNPNVTMEIVDGIARYMEQNHFASVQDMVGIVK